MGKSERIKRAYKAEDRFVKTINSGAFDFDKGDAKNDTNLLEIKHKEGKGFRITTKMLNKIWNEAFEANKFPIMGIVIDDEEDSWMLKVSITKERK